MSGSLPRASTCGLIVASAASDQFEPVLATVLAKALNESVIKMALAYDGFLVSPWRRQKRQFHSKIRMMIASPGKSYGRYGLDD